MHFTANKRGALLTATEVFLVGLALFGILAYFLFIIGALLAIAWAIICVALFYRLSRLRVTTEKGVLRVEKGRFFPLVLRVPTAYLTGVHIFQTPFEKRLNVCSVVGYTSGLTFVLLGISHINALELAALCCNGGNS